MFHRWFARGCLVVLFLLAIVLVWALTYRGPSYPPPVHVSLAQSNTPLVVSPGLSGVLFVLPDGSLWRWGKAGLNSLAAVPEPIGTNRNWLQATPGNNGWVGVRQDGTLWQAGWVGSGVRHFESPKQIGTNTHWRQATKVDTAAAALDSNGSLWTWGDSMNAGSLGDFQITSRADPGLVGTQRWQSVTGAGSNYGFIAATENGEVHVWGKPHQPGPSFPQPTQAFPGTHWQVLGTHTFLDTSRTLWFGPAVWSAGLSGTNSIVPISNHASPGRFALSGFKLYDIHDDGSLWVKALPVPRPWSSKKPNREPSHRVGTRSDWVQLWSSMGTVIGLTRDGTLWAWGTDQGAEPRLDTMSQLRKGLHDTVNFVCDTVGITRLMRSLQTTAYHRVDDTPRPLLVLESSP